MAEHLRTVCLHTVDAWLAFLGGFDPIDGTDGGAEGGADGGGESKSASGASGVGVAGGAGAGASAASRPKITQVFDLQLTPNLNEDGKSTVKFESPIAQVSVTVGEREASVVVVAHTIDTKHRVSPWYW